MSRRDEEHYHSPISIPSTLEFLLDIHTSFTEDILEFQTFSPKYADPYGDGLLTKINNAYNVVPDSQVLDVITGLTATVESVMETGRIELQKLFNFVEDAFPNSPSKLNEAGKNDYEEARKSQPKMLLLLDAAKDFADTYTVELDGKGYTAAMATGLSDAMDALKEANKEQNKEIRRRPVKTQERRRIINEAYDAVRDLCEDAKILYVNDYAKYNLYLIPGIDTGSSTSGPVGEGATAHVMRKTFKPTDQLKLESTGDTQLMFCVAPDEVTACVSGVTVNAGESVTVEVSELGDPATNEFLNVTNLDADQAGSWKVTMV